MSNDGVYDKAKYHLAMDYPKDLPESQACVHTGMFVTWLIEHDMLSDWLIEEAAASIEAVKRHEMTGPQFYEEEMCGVLSDENLNEEGNAFTASYYDGKGRFTRDYCVVMDIGDLPSIYHVQDTWENYELIKPRIDERYAEWLEKPAAAAAGGKKWWQFWRR